MELTVLIPCLNEKKSIAYCIKEAYQYIGKAGICAEILVVDKAVPMALLKLPGSVGQEWCPFLKRDMEMPLWGESKLLGVNTFLWRIAMEAMIFLLQKIFCKSSVRVMTWW